MSLETSVIQGDLHPTERMKKSVRFHELDRKDCSRKIDELVDLTGASWSSCYRILNKDLEIKSCNKLVLRLLKDGQIGHKWLAVVN